MNRFTFVKTLFSYAAVTSLALISILLIGSLCPDNAYAAKSTSFKIVYKLNGGSWPSSINLNNGEEVDKTIDSNARLKVSKISKPLRFGYKFSGWYANKSLKKRAVYIRGVKQLSKRTIYAKWIKAKNPYTFVKTKGVVDRIYTENVITVLNKHKKLAKRFYLTGGSITICSEQEYKKHTLAEDSAGNTLITGSGNSVSKMRWSPPRIYLRSDYGTDESVVLHEIGHWYHTCMQTEKTKKKIASLYKKNKVIIEDILGAYAASSVKEAYAETFAAIKSGYLGEDQMAKLGKWYSCIVSTIKH